MTSSRSTSAPGRLPIDSAPHIHLGSALAQPWDQLLSIDSNTMIFGNPPFVGSLLMTDDQMSDARRVWGDFKRLGTMDFVTNWFVLAARAIGKYGCRAAFVSTNSITQGEQVGVLWGEMNKCGVDISFAHQTFAWTNEAPDQAAVHVVVIGLSANFKGTRHLYVYRDVKSEPREVEAAVINAYLVDGPRELVTTRALPLNDGQTQMRFGSMPRDGGWLSKISAEEANEIRNTDEIASKYLRRLIGAEELINGKERWCLWLVNASKSELHTSRILRERTEKVRQMRSDSKAASTRAWANRPGEFVQQAQPDTPYIAVPGGLVRDSPLRSYGDLRA